MDYKVVLNCQNKKAVSRSTSHSNIHQCINQEHEFIVTPLQSDEDGGIFPVAWVLACFLPINQSNLEVFGEQTDVLHTRIGAFERLAMSGGALRGSATSSLSPAGPATKNSETLESIQANPSALNVLEERSSQPLSGVEDRLADDPIPWLLYRRAVEAALPLLPFRNKAADGGILTGIVRVPPASVLKPYNLRDGSAKGLNESPDVSDSLQNKILQHASIGTFLKHYLNDINVDLQGVYRRLDTQKDLMRFAYSMSRSIDPRRPRKLTPEQTASKAINRLYNEKQRKRRLLLKDIKERYKSEQPVKDSERPISGMVVDEDTRDALVRADMSPEQLGLIDAILTLPGESLEQELQRRMTAINAVTLYCGVEEGAPSRHVQRGPPGTVVGPTVQAAEPDIALRQAISSIKTDKRPKRGVTGQFHEFRPSDFA
ncbi:hypothetical protein DL98DRAFT_600433 [Cadophora sp. DSE1049]|nr:hypothetical protein DL98DRAFT_600433 [Cadophora sp. DSE1049]